MSPRIILFIYSIIENSFCKATFGLYIPQKRFLRGFTKDST